MRILVTGAGGFVGSHLVPRLVESGHDVSSPDREMDVTQLAVCRDWLARLAPEAIIHLAAQSSVAASVAQPEIAYRVTYYGARCLLEAAALETPGVRVLLVGSGDVYGPAPPGSPAFTEDAPLAPRSPYATAKAAADRLGALYAERGLDVVRPRPFNHTGPGQSDAFVAASFARQIAEMEAGQRASEMRVGNLDAVREFLDVRDVVSAYVALLDPKVPAAAYNVAKGTPVSVRQVLDQLIATAKTQPEISVDPERMRPTDISIGNAERLRSATDWQPRYSLEETVSALLEDWRRRVSAS